MRLTIAGVGVRINTHPIISDVDLAVEPGEMVAVVGPNGAGKSTLLRTIYRAMRPTTGVISLNGEDAWRMPAREAARRRAVVTQLHPTSADFTALEVVAMGRTPHKGPLDRDTSADRRIVFDALEHVGMTWAADRPFATLSGGECQRVLVARALAQEAPLVVLDEPTNHLDVRAQLDLLDLVRGLGVTILAALHDLNLAATYADRVAVLDRGHLVAIGPPGDVLTPDLIARVFGVRAHVGPHPLNGRLHVALARMHPEPEGDPA